MQRHGEVEHSKPGNPRVADAESDPGQETGLETLSGDSCDAGFECQAEEFGLCPEDSKGTTESVKQSS